jgi:UDP-glucose 4-epimerase
MNVLVTGGAGYIGSHTVHELIKNNIKVIVFDNESKGHREAVPNGVTLVSGDLRDKNLLSATIRQNAIEAVIHFAADSLVGESMQDPGKYYKNNVVGTISLLDAMRECSVGRIVFSSTAAVYGEPAKWPITEDVPTVPTNVYGRTKLIIEKILADYSSAYKLNYVSLRYFNAAGALVAGGIGEDHNPETHLIPLVLKTALGQRKAIDIYGTDYPTKDGTCIRDYIHVLDLADAHVCSLLYLAAGGKSNVYNLGSEEGYSVRQVIDEAKSVTGIDFPVNECERRLGDPAVLIASSTRIKKDLGWQRHFSDLKTIIGTAWNWHKNNPHGFNTAK